MLTLLAPAQLPRRRVHLEPPDKRATYCGTHLQPGLATSNSADVANCPHCLRVYDVEMSNQPHNAAAI